MTDPLHTQLPPIDDEPEVCHDEHPEATPAEIVVGDRLGETIDVDDDEDNGINPEWIE